MKIVKDVATIDDLMRMPRDGRKYEWVDGRILVSPAGMRHAKVAGRILHLLATFLDDSPIGEVYSDGVGILFPTGNLRSPDVTFVRFEKLPTDQLRHADHRFEWTRAEFLAWASERKGQGYSFTHHHIGEVDRELGAPSQMGVFVRDD